MAALLCIIYISFISLGLPDSLVGTAWPSISVELSAPLSLAGVISMIVAGCTIISSLLSDRLIRRLGTGKLTLISVAMTALALLGISVAPSFWVICAIAVPLGLGAGSVDAALNNFVALHYKARHMSWLHCFWGIGATAGPIIMSLYLARQGGWKLGFRTVGVIQCCLVAVLAVTLPLWKRAGGEGGSAQQKGRALSIPQMLRLKNVRPVLVAFLCYCGMEMAAGLWGASYLTISRGISAETAAQWVSLYYLGITFGRLLSGLATVRLTSKQVIRIGEAFIVLGLVLLLLPLGDALLPVGLCLVGVGCAPIYPGMLHETPNNFGAENSQSLMGFQMACAYVGTTLVPPLFGLIAQYISAGLYPVFLLAFVLPMILCSEKVFRSRGAK